MADDKKDLTNLKSKLQLKTRRDLEPEPAPVVAPSAAAPEPEKKPLDDFALPFDQQPAFSEEDAESHLAADEIALSDGSAHKGKGAIMTIAIVVALLAVGITGLMFGRVFKARAIENVRIDEALSVKQFMDKSKTVEGKKVYDAVEDFIVEINTFIGEVEKARKDGKTPVQMKPRIVEFLGQCDAFVKNNTYFPPSKVFPTNLFNADVLSVGLPVVLNVKQLYDATERAASMHAKIKALETPKAAVNVSVFIDVQEESFTPKKVKEEDPEPGAVQIKRASVTLVDAGGIEENPMWAEASKRERRAMPQWLIPFSVPGDKAVKAARTDQIGQLDVQPLLTKKDQAFVNNLIGDALALVYEMKASAARVKFKKFKELLLSYESREKYFTL